MVGSILIPFLPPLAHAYEILIITAAQSSFNVANAQAFYFAARTYNSGSVQDPTNLANAIATKCYTSDVANRLTGWVFANNGVSPCTDQTALG